MFARESESVRDPWFQLSYVSKLKDFSKSHAVTYSCKSGNILEVVQDTLLLEITVRKWRMAYWIASFPIILSHWENRGQKSMHGVANVWHFVGWLDRSTAGIKPLNLITKLQKRQENDVVAAVNARILAWRLDWNGLSNFQGHAPTAPTAGP